ncbi:hypothetical protein ACLN6N_12320 [Sphingomonas carotinifaciens]|uniref:Uncharacterized protein n=1 Tax=Sphingomonas carotinifaciens TaxID=1166323 RepID=A0A1G7GF91_9SPHN|nr:MULTISPECIES: hypothetical protein [Sphingomonas]MBB4086495.1 flagellar basal body-associated protein FliL [Sphingomonas carotinifaciens]MWC42847.1 hypothetical protein [Sphingomonas carotinifaciens]SDE86794.1 hypothetical protein SAMN05216557_101854 [Sphingomonas carotinifaciens]
MPDPHLDDRVHAADARAERRERREAPIIRRFAVIIAVVFVLGILTYAGMIFSHARQKERSDANATQVATPRDPMPDR